MKGVIGQPPTDHCAPIQHTYINFHNGFAPQMTVQSQDDNGSGRVSVVYHNTPSAPVSPPRPSYTPSRPPPTPKI
ncbi:hypothetical protein CVT24_006405 [Panaeolus cyanescens]|uniref:Uncharacterized protein n=1 Tax=Panaeolus cyanescens TaxID=181874 RepID=A0A409WIA3_9AGAR|nr:hypothetical protein CVT24_006405 [Panaeolus cyanescens]